MPGKVTTVMAKVERPGQGLRRLEPERAPQDHDRPVLVARPPGSDRVDAGDVGRGRDVLGRRRRVAVRGRRRAGARRRIRRPVRAGADDRTTPARARLRADVASIDEGTDRGVDRSLIATGWPSGRGRCRLAARCGGHHGHMTVCGRRTSARPRRRWPSSVRLSTGCTVRTDSRAASADGPTAAAEESGAGPTVAAPSAGDRTSEVTSTGTGTTTTEPIGASSSTTTTEPPLTGWAATDAYLLRRIIGDGSTAASFAISVDGEIVHTAAMGVRTLDVSEAAATTDRFRIASISKVITAITVLQPRRAGLGRHRRPRRRADRVVTRVWRPNRAAPPTSPCVSCSRTRPASASTRTSSSARRSGRAARPRRSGSAVRSPVHRAAATGTAT